MNPDPQNQVSPQTLERVYEPVTPRTFLKGTAAAMAGVAGVAAALKPLLALERGELTLDDLLQKHYRELKPAELQRVLKALEDKCEKEHGVRPTIHDLKPLPEVVFGAWARGVAAGGRVAGGARLAAGQPDHATGARVHRGIERRPRQPSRAAPGASRSLG